MALLKRFDTLEVATTDLADAVKTYRENFGFELTPGSSGRQRDAQGGRRGNPAGRGRRGGGDDRR